MYHLIVLYKHIFAYINPISAWRLAMTPVLAICHYVCERGPLEILHAMIALVQLASSYLNEAAPTITLEAIFPFSVQSSNYFKRMHIPHWTLAACTVLSVVDALPSTQSGANPPSTGANPPSTQAGAYPSDP